MSTQQQRTQKGVVNIHVGVISIPARGVVNRIVGIAPADKEEFRVRLNAWIEERMDVDGFPETVRAICIDPGIPTWMESRIQGVSLDIAAKGVCEVLREMGYVPRLKSASDSSSPTCFN